MAKKKSEQDLIQYRLDGESATRNSMSISGAGTVYGKYAGQTFKDLHQSRMEKKHKEDEADRAKFFADRKAKALENESNLIPSRNASGQSGVNTVRSGRQKMLEGSTKNSQSISQAGYNYDRNSQIKKAINAAATKNSQSIAKAGTVYRSSVGTKTEPKKNTSVNTPSLIKGGKNGAKDAVNGDVRIVNQGRPRSTDDYDRSRKAIENAFGKQTQDKGTVTTAPKSSPKANTAAATRNSQSISQAGYNYDRNKQTGRKQIEEAFTPSSTSKPTSTIKVGGVKGSVKVTPKTTTSKPSSTIASQPSRKEPAYNPAKINAEAKARAEAQSKAAAAQAAAKANAKGGMSEEAKKKAAAAAARRGR